MLSRGPGIALKARGLLADLHVAGRVRWLAGRVPIGESGRLQGLAIGQSVHSVRCKSALAMLVDCCTCACTSLVSSRACHWRCPHTFTRADPGT